MQKKRAIINVADKFDKKWPPLKRFWFKTNKNGPIHPVHGQCWVWTGKTRNGYGRFSINKKVNNVNRYSWTIHFGKIPKGLCVCHKCDNPRCVNPAHLFLGTTVQNTNDRQQKQRQARGEKIHSAILTESQVIYIRKVYKSHSKLYGASALAHRFGVAYSTLLDVVINRTWKHLVRKAG